MLEDKEKQLADLDIATQKRSHFDIALLIALVPVVGAAVRIWMYSGGDVAVFLVLLRTLNAPAVLIGTCVLIVPSLVLVLLVILQTDWKARDRARDWWGSHKWVAPVIVILVFILIYTASWKFWVSFAAIGLLSVANFLIRRFWPWGRRHIVDLLVAQRGNQNGPTSILTLISAMILLLSVPWSMWLPLEKVKMAHAGDQVAYVLESTTEWTTLLTSSRTLAIVATSDVESRAVCRVSLGGSIMTLMDRGDIKDTPDCSK